VYRAIVDDLPAGIELAGKAREEVPLFWRDCDPAFPRRTTRRKNPSHGRLP